ncbi:MAG TPA: hypothetical protein DHV17_00100 [Chitinophagaceae bacterium]|nr:hypothetical protein [Chitinophagaceae bacterium]
MNIARFLLAGSLLCSFSSFAQTPTSLQLEKGRKLTLQNNSSTNADLGMGMEMKNNSNQIFDIEVIDINETTLSLQFRLKKLTMDIDAMGQQVTYDSDKESDRQSEVGKSIPEDMYKTDTVRISRLTGKLIDRKKKNAEQSDANENPMAGMMSGIGNADQGETVADMFFMIPKDIKTGDTWKDSLIDKSMKKYLTYTLQDIEGDKATVLVNEQSNISTESEVQGMAMQVNMSGNNKYSLTVDVKTGLTIKKTMYSDVTGTIEVMGQSQNISSKSKSEKTVL